MVDEFIGFVILAIAGIVLLPLLLSIIALVKVSGLKRQIQELRAGSPIDPGESPNANLSTAKPLPELPVITPRDVPKQQPIKSAKKIWAKAINAESKGEAVKSTPKLKEPRKPRDFSNWMVWVGEVALALGGLFVLRVAAEQGLFGPSARIALATVSGLLMIGFGEWARRKGKLLRMALEGRQANMVPVILASAGLITLYGACFAAFSLYGMIGSTAAFVLLALISAAAFIAAFSFGPFLIIAGLIGAYVAPLLVASDVPSIYAFVGYLLFPAASSLFVARYIEQPRIGWLTLLGAWIWGLMILLGTAFDGDDVLGSAIYNLAVVAIFAVAASWKRDAVPALENVSLKYWLMETPPLVKAAFLGALISALALIFNMVVLEGKFIEVTMVFSGTLAVYMALALWRQALVSYGLIGAVTGILGIGLWMFSRVGAPVESGPLVRYGVFPFWETVPALTGELNSFLLLLSAAGGAVALISLYKVFRGQQSGAWGTLAAFVPVALFAVAAMKVTAYGHNFAWLTVAFLLALYAFVVVMYLHKRLQLSAMVSDEKAIGLMAAGVIVALALGLSFALNKASLTVAISVMLPVLAWIYSRYSYKVFRWVALFFSLLILGRIFIDPWLLSLPMEGWNRLPWVWFAYGLPLAFFVLAAKYFRTSTSDLTTHVLDIGRLVFASLLVGFSIRVVAGVESLDSEQLSFLEAGLHATAGFSFALGLRRLYRKGRSMIFAWGGKLFALLASLYWIGLVTFFNPVLTGDPVGSVILFNALAFAYLAPALLMVLLLLDLNLYGPKPLAKPVLLGSVVSAVVFLGLSIRHLFHGSTMGGGVYQSESLTYSAVGLAIGIALFLYAHFKQSEVIRRPALAILAVVAAKVFLLDTAGLDGLLRAASLMGLGASLVALGWLYQKGLAKHRAETEEGA